GEVQVSGAGPAVKSASDGLLDVEGQTTWCFRTHTELDERAGSLQLRCFLEGAHSHLVAAVGATQKNHWPAIGLGVAESGNRVRHTGRGYGQGDAGSACQVADRAGCVRRGLFVTHPYELDALALECSRDRLHGKADQANAEPDTVGL